MPDLAGWRQGAAMLSGGLTVVMMVVAVMRRETGGGHGSKADVLMMSAFRPVGYGIDAKTAVYDDEDISSDIFGAKKEVHDKETSNRSNRNTIPQNILARFAEDRAAFDTSHPSKKTSMLIKVLKIFSEIYMTGQGMQSKQSTAQKDDESGVQHVISALQDHVDHMARSKSAGSPQSDNYLLDLQKELVDVKEGEDKKIQLLSKAVKSLEKEVEVLSSRGMSTAPVLYVPSGSSKERNGKLSDEGAQEGQSGDDMAQGRRAQQSEKSEEEYKRMQQQYVMEHQQQSLLPPKPELSSSFLILVNMLFLSSDPQQERAEQCLPPSCFCLDEAKRPNVVQSPDGSLSLSRVDGEGEEQGCVFLQALGRVGHRLQLQAEDGGRHNTWKNFGQVMTGCLRKPTGAIKERTEKRSSVGGGGDGGGQERTGQDRAGQGRAGQERD
ncbi:hypothetical protein GUITHDRAFT_137317 [Guillardia theta CCMP2712]|uniref:Uncharacterized protein n=1 Tax=Guillardia theta (strain CCMP2712) TaxID=905079 RepID=L1JHC0_GUITC|nr:hypothetical protein GUITHDRAFT_137317 [Guillardia theta CCMP2712]EKX47534.1 hypothetical protein GUITHDRAFT_137317 [Guillardia theta CCMP2712]|eukprot:XP_005834514.1 hypothetical protein GUITHDRAFT_137317 [Guillardia theta CCMP2712]